MKELLYKIILLLFLFTKTTSSIAQYNGGSNDGYNFASYNKQSTTDANAFRGGINDGFTLATYNKQSSTDANAFKGGTNDGYNVATYNKQSATDANAFKGGTNDGFSNAKYNKQSFTDVLAFKGGSGRGETQKIYYAPYCNGIAIRIWNGSVSTAWENPNNWNCGILPAISSEVIVPNTVPRFPVVNFNYEIKKLTINPNASINIMPGVSFKLNGF
jgi:hypothetical protein